MKSANNLDNNGKWINAQMSTIRDGEIVFVWREQSARVRDMDLAVKRSDMIIEKTVGTLYTMYYKRRK